jgi:hypothetical protein
MVESFAAGASGFDGNGNVFLDALLADVFVKAFGADAGVEARVFVPSGAGNEAGGRFVSFIAAPGQGFLLAEVCH